MNIQLLYPTLLVALAGLLVPLLIHLWNRRQGRVVLFGSTQFLETTQRKKVSRISFTQPLLFLLRALMIGACVLLLVEPVQVSILQILPQKNANWLLISPSLLERDDWENTIDTLRYRGYERRVLARGFALASLQPLKGSQPTFPAASAASPLGAGGVWSLLAHTSVHPQAPDSIAVYFTPELNDFEGVAPGLPMHIRWHEIPPKNDAYHMLHAWEESDSKLAVIVGKSDEEHTTFKRYIFRKKAPIQSDELPDIIYEENEQLIYFKNKKNTFVLLENKPKLNAIIFYDNLFKKDRNYLIAALKSISEFTDIQIDIRKEKIGNEDLDFNLNEEPDAVFYLSEKTLNDSIAVRSNFRLFTYKKNEVYKEDFIGETFVEDKKIYILTRRLTDAESSIKLPQKLLEVLLTPNDFDTKLAQFDQRKIAPSQYKVKQVSNLQQEEILPAEKKEIAGFHDILWWFLLALFFTERMIVTRRNSA